MAYQLLTNIHTLVTMSGTRNQPAPVIQNAAVLIRNNVIEWLGTMQQLPQALTALGITPALVIEEWGIHRNIVEAVAHDAIGLDHLLPGTILQVNVAFPGKYGKHAEQGKSQQ